MFVNGTAFTEAASISAVATTPASFRADAAGTLLHVNFGSLDPASVTTEVTVRERCFAPRAPEGFGLGWITVRGFVMEHCANQYPAAFWSSGTPQAGALGTRGGHHWVIENNLVRHAKSIGIDCGSEGAHDADGLGQPMPGEAGDHLIRNNIVSENGVCGIAGYRHRRTRVSGNIVDRNNLLGLRSYEEAGIKFHLFTDGVVEGNLLRGNLSRAIWMDNRNTGSRVTRNVCIGSGAQGIFVELDSGPLLVDSNIVGRSRLENHPPDPRGDGIYMHDASGITLAHNLLFDNPDFGVNLRVVTSRGMNTASGKVEASNNRIVNNVFAANGMGALSIPFPDARAHGNSSDGNLFDAPGPYLWSTLAGAPLEAIRARAGEQPPVLRSRVGKESGVALDLDGWRRLAGFDAGSAAGMVKVLLDEDSLTLEIEIDQAARAVRTEAVPGVERVEPVVEVRAQYLVGCDGAHSTVRKSLGLTMRGDRANQGWGVMDVLAVTDFPDIRFKAVIHSANEGNLLIIPREGGYLVRLYIELDKLNPNERITERNITVDRLIAAAQRILQPYTLEVKEVAWWSFYEIGQRLCDKFDDVPDTEPAARLPCVFIAGDACHTHSPKAGQGMNVSMQDAFNLGWKLAAVLLGRCTPQLLHTYSAERRAIAKELIDFDRKFAQMFSAPPKDPDDPDSEGVDPAEFQRYFVQQGRFTAGTATCYKPSLITGEPRWQHLAPGFAIGMRFHSAPVIRLADAKPVHLGHTVKADGRWRLFAFAGNEDRGTSPSRVRELAALAD